MMWFKMCPNCGGDLYRRDQIDSIEITCIQCSHMIREEELPALLRQQAKEKKRKVA